MTVLHWGNVIAEVNAVHFRGCLPRIRVAAPRRLVQGIAALHWHAGSSGDDNTVDKIRISKIHAALNSLRDENPSPTLRIGWSASPG
ncbi:MAG: hypothetical protein LBD85_01875 [Oscillospiraceae bacterium]|nr:hypothetical protein [Oscillospiraceae bacterium]